MSWSRNLHAFLPVEVLNCLCNERRLICKPVIFHAFYVYKISRHFAFILCTHGTSSQCVSIFPEHWQTKTKLFYEFNAFFHSFFFLFRSNHFNLSLLFNNWHTSCLSISQYRCIVLNARVFVCLCVLWNGGEKNHSPGIWTFN